MPAIASDSRVRAHGAKTGSTIRRKKSEKKNHTSSMDLLADECEWASFSKERTSSSAFVSASSWMGQPVDGDASWLPVEPPNVEEARDDYTHTSRHSEVESRSSFDRNVTGEERNDRLRPPSGRSPQRRRATHRDRPVPARSNSRNDISDAEGSISLNEFFTNGVPDTPPMSPSSEQRPRGRGGRKSRTTPPRSRRSIGAVPSSPTSSKSKENRSRTETTPSLPSRGRLTRRYSAPSATRDNASLTNPNGSSDARGSGTRGRTPSPVSRGRFRSRSSNRTPVTGPQSERSRSTSLTSVKRGRDRSRSKNRSDRQSSNLTPAAIPQASRSRSSSLTPSIGRRSRSQSTTRSVKTEGRGTPSRLPKVPSGSSNSIGPGLPPRHRQVSVHELGERVGDEITFGTANRLNVSPGMQVKRKEGGIMEKLFGDQVSDEAKRGYRPPSEVANSIASPTSNLPPTQQPDCIHPRVLLSATVYHNNATNLWIATINTNQKGVVTNQAAASKHLKAFSFVSEREARESAIANAPPKMISFEDCPNCFACNGKFAMFRRASHCRNCGVCVCNSCSTTWPSKMIPETYNLKRESTVKICNSCHFLTMAFKRTLENGDYEGSIALYGTGNINLRCPFPSSRSDKKGETMYVV